MIERSIDLWNILVELLFVIFVQVVEVDRVWTEDEVIEGGDADILIHGEF